MKHPRNVHVSIDPAIARRLRAFASLHDSTVSEVVSDAIVAFLPTDLESMTPTTTRRRANNK